MKEQLQKDFKSIVQKAIDGGANLLWKSPEIKDIKITSWKTDIITKSLCVNWDSESDKMLGWDIYSLPDLFTSEPFMKAALGKTCGKYADEGTRKGTICERCNGYPRETELMTPDGCKHYEPRYLTVSFNCTRRTMAGSDVVGYLYKEVIDG